MFIPKLHMLLIFACFFLLLTGDGVTSQLHKAYQLVFQSGFVLPAWQYESRAAISLRQNYPCIMKRDTHIYLPFVPGILESIPIMDAFFRALFSKITKK